MDEVERTQDPSLPPNYVSLAQLQERWLQKQQELNLKKKEEEEQKEREANQKLRESENDLREVMAGLSVRNVPRRKWGKDGRKASVIEDERKGKDKVIDRLQGGHQEKAKKKWSIKQKKSGAGEEKVWSEIKEGRSEGVDIVPGNEVKLELEKKVKDEKGYGTKWVGRRINRKNRNEVKLELDSRLKENKNDVLKGNEAEEELKHKLEEEVLAICVEEAGLNGRSKNDDKVESAKNVKHGYKRYGSSEENGGRRFGRFSFNDRNNVRSRMEGNFSDGRRYTRYGDGKQMKPRKSDMVWVRKEEKKDADVAQVFPSGMA